MVTSNAKEFSYPVNLLTSSYHIIQNQHIISVNIEISLLINILYGPCIPHHISIIIHSKNVTKTFYSILNNTTIDAKFKYRWNEEL